MAKGLPHLLGHMGLLGHTAAQADDLLRVAALHMDQRPQVAQHPLLGVLPDGAGVQNDDPGLLLIGGEVIAHLAQIAPDALGVGLVLLAAIGVHKGQGSLPPVGVHPGDLPAVLQLAVYLRLRDGGCDSFHLDLRNMGFETAAAGHTPWAARPDLSVCSYRIIVSFFPPGDKKSGTEKSSCRHLRSGGGRILKTFCKPSRFFPLSTAVPPPPHCLFPGSMVKCDIQELGPDPGDRQKGAIHHAQADH